MRRTPFVFFLIILVLPLGLLAQEPASGVCPPSPRRRDQIRRQAKGFVKGRHRSGMALYALDQPPGGPVATTIKITEGSQFEIAGKVDSRKPIVRRDPLFITADGKPLDTKFFADNCYFSVPLKAHRPNHGR